LRLGGLRLEVDLAAEQVFAAERGEEYIAVEIKSFLSKSKLADFYEAKGKYDLYRLGLKKEERARHLFLAIDKDVYKDFFQKSLIQEMVEEDKISFIIIDIETKTIVEWIKK
jgi:XisH protein